MQAVEEGRSRKVGSGGYFSKKIPEVERELTMWSLVF